MLLWCDGFDHYGSNIALMRNGAYAEVNGASLTNSPAFVRTGTRALLLSSIGGSARRVFGAQKQAVGVGVAFNLITSLPDDEHEFMRFEDSAGTRSVFLIINSAGEICARVGVVSITEIARSGVVVGASSYQHLEAKVVIDAVAGAVEVRLNGVTVLNVSGVDTQTTSAETSTVTVRGSGHTGGIAIDDFYAWDEEGYQNNDFIGDKKVYTVFPDADTSTEEWELSVGVDSYAILNNNPPVDATDYLYSEGPGVRTDVEVAALPPEIVSIAGVFVPTRMWKTDAGNSKVRVGIVSGVAEDFGAPHALSMAASYYGDVFETDPDTGALWTLSALNAVQLAIDRTE